MNHLFIINNLKNKINSNTILILPKNSGLENYRTMFETFQNEKIIVRAEDVPIFIEKLSKKGINCIGLTGSDLFFNYQLNGSKIKILNKIEWFDENALFKKPTICLMGKEKFNEINNSIIAVNSKYKNISLKFLENYSPKEIIYFNGATETAAFLGIADFVIDIVYSGKSAMDFDLEIKSKIFESNIVILGGEENEA